jgi:dipeptidyl aminopeptidase/acylaminoacyl peptidase
MVRPTDFDEPTQDYADARKAFKTTLTTQGKAPQKWKTETPPAGAREIDYTSGDLKLKAWVDAPPKGGPAKPAVLFLHGGFAFGAEDWDQCKPFRDAGFVTLVPMFRGENGLPGHFTLFYDEVDDCLAAAEVLARQPGVDPNRIYVAGHSAGGTLAMLSAMTSKRFKACASFSGSPDQVTFVRDTPGVAPFDPDDRQELAMRSPLAYYQSFKCPARLYYGNDEGPITELATKKLAQKATAAGKDVRAVEVSGDHMSAVDPAIRQAVTFFQQTR